MQGLGTMPSGVAEDLEDIFEAEVSEASKGWRGLTSQGLGDPNAMDAATAAAAAAADASGRAFKVAIIGAGASGTTRTG